MSGFQRVCKLWFGRLAIPAASVALLSLGVSGSGSWAADFFSGVSGIVIKPGNAKDVQVIEFRADMPFEYQMQVLGRNDILLRLYNAQIASELIDKQGLVQVDSESPSLTVMSGGSGIDSLTRKQYHEIVLTGPQLGEKKLQIIGAEELPLPKPAMTPVTPTKAAKIAPARPAITPAANIVPARPVMAPVFAPKPAKAATPARKISSKPKAGRSKQVVVFPNLAEVENNPQHAALNPQGADEPTVLLGTETQPAPKQAGWLDLDAAPLKPATPLASAAAKPAAPKIAPAPKATKSTANIKVAKANGPAIAAISDVPPALSRFRPEDLVAMRAPMQNQMQTESVSIAQPPSLSAMQAFPGPGYDASQSIPANELMQQEAAAEAPEAENEQEPEILIPLPRYKGGAPPIQAATLDSKGQPIVLKPKNMAIPEFGVGGQPVNPQNMLFQAESEDTSTRVNRLMASALEHYRDNAWDQALQDIRQAVVMDSTNADLYAAQAEIEVKQSNLINAVKSYEKAVKLAPGKHDYRYAQVLVMAGRRADAIRVLERLYHENPNRAQVIFMLGTLHEEQGNMQRALEYLKQAAQLHPGSADVQYNLGLAYELSGSREEAELHYRKALNLDPKARDAAQALERVKH